MPKATGYLSSPLTHASSSRRTRIRPPATGQMLRPHPLHQGHRPGVVPTAGFYAESHLEPTSRSPGLRHPRVPTLTSPPGQARADRDTGRRVDEHPHTPLLTYPYVTSLIMPGPVSSWPGPGTSRRHTPHKSPVTTLCSPQTLRKKSASPGKARRSHPNTQQAVALNRNKHTHTIDNHATQSRSTSR